MSTEERSVTSANNPTRAGTANAARLYDWWLDGKDNYAVDQEAAAQIEALVPNARKLARQNRAFLRRAVEYLASECEVSQFVDIGSGLPSAGNVHEIAQAIRPKARVVYVDNDPVVLSHGRAILAKNENTTILEADLRDPDSILMKSELLRLIDPRKPVALLMVASLHFIPDSARPDELLSTYRAWLPVGGYLAISHADLTPEHEAAARGFDKLTSSPVVPRTHSQVRRFLGDFKLANPGLVQLPAWRPATGITRHCDIPVWGGVGRKIKTEKADG